MAKGRLTIVIEHDEETKQFAVLCKELGTATCGDTFEEALSNAEDAIMCHLDSLKEHGVLEKFLKERNLGWLYEVL